MGAVGDGQDHRRDGHRHDLGVPRLVGEQADHDHAEHDQTAYRRDVPEIAGDPGFMPKDVVTGQQEQGRDQAEDANGTTSALAQSRARLRGLVLHPQQDKLLLADCLPLFDQDVAFGEGVKVLVHSGAGLVAQPRGNLRLMSQG